MSGNFYFVETLCKKMLESKTARIFQQDGATSYTASETLDPLQEDFKIG